MKLVFHVGMPKCGTSTLQETCDKLSDNLANNGVLYPQFREFDRLYRKLQYLSSGNGNPFMYLCRMSADPSVSPGLDRAAVFDSLRAQIAEVRPDLVVLSHEDMIILPVADMIGVAAAIGLRSTDITVMLHVRRHDLWIASDYQQHIKQLRDHTSIERHVARRLRSILFSDVCERFARELGEDRVIVRLVDRRTMRENIVEDFFAALGRDTAFLRDLDLVESNEGIPAAYVPVLLLANARGIPNEDFIHLLRRAAAARRDKPELPGYRLPTSLAMLVWEYFSEDRRRLERFLSRAEMEQLAEKPDGWSDMPEVDATTQAQLQSFLGEGSES